MDICRYSKSINKQCFVLFFNVTTFLALCEQTYINVIHITYLKDTFENRDLIFLPHQPPIFTINHIIRTKRTLRVKALSTSW